MPPILSYYWTSEALASEASERALQCLVSRDCTLEQRVAAFSELLESGDVAARCIAFEQFDRASTQGRFGLAQPFEAHRQRMLEVARAELAAAPVSSSVEGRHIDAANHASALHALARAGTEEDLPRIARVLSQEEGEDVLVAACLAVTDLLREASTAYPGVAADLRRIAMDPRRADFLQEQAVCALDNDKGPARAEVLVEIATHGRYPAAGHAARLLALDSPEQYRELLERLVRQWPENYPAIEVRRLLTEPRDEDS